MAFDLERAEKQAAYRDLFRIQLDGKAIDDIRLALNQNPPLGDSRSYAKIEATTGQRRQAVRQTASMARRICRLRGGAGGVGIVMLNVGNNVSLALLIFRNILNVPGMLPAAGMTWMGLRDTPYLSYDTIQRTERRAR